MRLEEYLITEARKATTSTEDLHEIFFALSIAGYIQGNNQLNKVDNLTDLLSFIDKIIPFFLNHDKVSSIASIIGRVEHPSSFLVR